MRKIVQLILFLSMVGFLESCATIVNNQSSNNSGNRQSNDRLQESPIFNLNGRFLVRATQKSETGNFVWIKTNQGEELDLINPLGGVMVKLVIDSAGMAKFIDIHHQEYTGSGLNQIMQEQLGFILPLKQMHYWVQGVAIPNIPVTNITDNGFSQLNWKISYLMRYTNQQPKLIKLESRDFMIKLLINWN